MAGLLHDLGKYNPAFQQYLIDAYVGRPATSTPHAVYGAMMALEQNVPELSQMIYGHHAGMPSPTWLQEAFADLATRETYVWVKVAAEGSGWEFNPPSSPEKPSVNLAGEMLLRMIFSALVDADFHDTEQHFDPERAAARSRAISPTQKLLPILLEKQERLMLGARGTVNDVRREVYESCLFAGKLEPGIYRLCAPTGAGKTRSALTFALSQAADYNLARVIYAVPYLTITDQVAQEARGIFGAENVLEHHSGVLSKEPSWRNRLATENWDASIIVTTTVQLLESLLSNRPSRCRKLHNIVNSVIILDEVQTLPVRMLQPILSVLDELVDRYACTIVLSTATQPALDASSRFLEGFADVSDIVPVEKARQHFEKLRRVRYEIEREPWSWVRVAEELRGQERAMAIVNTRRDAQQLHTAARALGVAHHLSASMCQAHRAEVLRDVRRKLADGVDSCILISTQVVEAGVDVDFDAVLRAFGPLDSIVQAAGRCNREGRRAEGRVVVYEPAEAGALPGADYRTATNIASNMLRRTGARTIDLHDPSVFGEYFRRLYQILPRDAQGIQDLRRAFDYPTVAERFRIIDDAQTDVIILYDETARALVERIREEGELRRGDLGSLQAYTVGLYPRDFEREEANREEVVEGLWLWTGAYDSVRGIQLQL